MDQHFILYFYFFNKQEILLTTIMETQRKKILYKQNIVCIRDIVF